MRKLITCLLLGTTLLVAARVAMTPANAGKISGTPAYCDARVKSLIKKKHIKTHGDFMVEYQKCLSDPQNYN